MLASYFSDFAPGQEAPEKLACSETLYPDTDFRSLAICLSRLVYRNSDENSVSSIVSLRENTPVPLDISTELEQAKILYDTLDSLCSQENYFPADNTAVFDALPNDICYAIYRNMLALSYASNNQNSLHISAAMVHTAPILRSVPEAPGTYASRYVISTCTAINKALLAIFTSKHYGEEFASIAIPLASHPMAGWADKDYVELLKEYAASEMVLHNVIAMTSDLNNFSKSFTHVPSDSLYGKITGYSNPLGTLRSRIFDKVSPIVHTFNEILANAALMLNVAAIAVTKCVNDSIQRVRNEVAASVGDTQVEQSLPGSHLYNALPHTSDSQAALRMESLAYMLNMVSVYTNLRDKYAGSGFPGTTMAFCNMGSKSASVPVLAGYSAENMVDVVLVPSTEHAAAMLRVMYGLPKMSGLFQSSPAQEILLGYTDQGYAGRIVAKSQSISQALVYLGLMDIRSFIFGTEPRPAGDCPKDELFHAFA